MGQVTQLQASLYTARKNLAQAERMLALNGAERTRVGSNLEQLLRSGNKAAVVDAKQQLAQLDTDKAAAEQKVNDAKGAVNNLLKQFELVVDPATLIAELNPYPIAMLPVRLETRYFRVGQTNPELCIRIYPDDIHVDSHEPELTQTELKWGRAYWEGAWRASDDLVRAKKVWSILVDQVGPQRAAWVALQTTPTNPSDSPTKPIAENDPLPVAPVFPTPDLKGDDWTRAAVARMLPDRWRAIGYRAKTQVFAVWGNPVPDVLAVSLSPGGGTPPPGQLPVDEGMRWMVDFERAVEVGMGIRITFATNAELSLDQLLVIGVKTSAGPENAAELLATTLDAHHYTDGLALVPQGTPTNNSSEQSSGFASRETDAIASYQTERGKPLFAPGKGADGERLTTFLGVARAPGSTAPEVFAHVRHADGFENLDARHMNTALWPATWGYYLRVMMEGVLTDQGRDLLRRHFIDYVHGRGPLAALRVGRQPYGVLPALSLDLWDPMSADRDPLEWHLVDKLRVLRQKFWRESLWNVPRIGRTDDIDADLVATLAMDATSLHYAVRKADGNDFIKAALGFGKIPYDEQCKDLQINDAIDPLLTLGIQAQPPLCGVTYDVESTELNRPLVQSLLSETEPPQYISWVLLEDMFSLTQELDEKSRPATLLHLLLRHALRLAYTTAATKIAKNDGLPLAQAPEEPIFVNIDPSQVTMTAWDVMASPTTSIPNQQPIGEYLFTTDLFANFDTVQVGELLASLGYLAARPSAALERLMTETLDLSVHRLDAWITSLATKKLESHRQGLPRGIYLGGYGYVENLKPDEPRIPVQPPPGEAGSPIYETDSPAGFIHAPSIAHATAAAVLRSGHLSHTGAAGNLLAVDLSSQRVRLAQWLVDGVRQGQPLGALLGYRFERGLHEGHPTLQLDKYIAPLRKKAPLVAGKVKQSGEVIDENVLEAIAARNVVDGLQLHKLWKETGITWGSSNGLPDLNSEEQKAILAELESLDQAIDSISDVVVAESVYQATQGNMMRAGATLDAVSAGDVPPPELEVVRTPRTGIGITHRLVAFLQHDDSTPAGWSNQVRAAAEPALNAWTAKLLGDPARIKVRAEYLNAETKEIEAGRSFALSELNFAPLDLLYTNEGSKDAPLGDIEQRFLYHAERNRPPEASDAATVTLTTDHIEALAPSDLSLAEFFSAIKAVRDLCLQSRPLQASDIALPNDQTMPNFDLVDLKTRATSVLGSLVAVKTTLGDLLADPGGPPDPDSLRQALVPFTHFGFEGALPKSARGDNEEQTKALRIQAEAILQEAETRHQRITALEQGFSEENDAKTQRDNYVARIRAALGEGFHVLPHFEPANGSELQQTFGDAATLLEGDKAAPLVWFSRAARVRPGVARLNAAMSYAELMNTGETLSLDVGQLPSGNAERWVGLPSVEPVLGGRISLVAYGVADVDVTGRLCGLLIDDWTEVIPNKSELTCVVFQHDAPGARAPHAVLLAVAPGFGPTWTLPALEATVLETMELAQLRTVDADALRLLGHFLPGLFCAFNVANDTVSVNFIDYAKEERP